MLRIVFSTLILLFFVPAISQPIEVANLKCEYKVNPAGIEARAPKLSWELHSEQRNVLQAAYRIIVADDARILDRNIGNVWDSKKVGSGQSIQVSYTGKTLSATKRYYWKVMVWGNRNGISAWSKTARWQMGLLTKTDWKNAKWIAYEKLADSNVNILPTDGKKDKFTGNNILPMLRKSFTIRKPVKEATAY